MKNKSEEERSRVVGQYREFLYSQPGLLEKARRELRGKVLGCWCAPKLCHGHVLAEAANSDLTPTQLIERNSEEIRVIEPGLVLIKRAVRPYAQTEMTKMAMKIGNDPETGFWEKDKESGTTKLNSTRTRGRVYNRIGRFDDRYARMCRRLSALANGEDEEIPIMDPTHMLLLYYPSMKGIGFHRDEGENDGTGDLPIVSLSMGNACEFAFKHERGEAERSVRLESGDAILFGGPCRMILHSVKRIYAGTSPPYLREWIPDARLNFTFRCTPEAIGRKDTEFRFFKPSKGYSK